MTDVEATLREGLNAFADETTAIASPPAVASIALRAQVAAPRRSRWRKVAVVVAGAALLSTGVGAALGVLPAPVESKLREFRSWGFNADRGASRMASVTDGGMTYEVWRAPLRGGGECVYDRVIGRDGDVDHGGAAACAPVEPSSSPTQFRSLHYPERVGELRCGKRTWGTNRCVAVASGQLPAGASAAVFELDDGTTHTAVAQTNGFFITTFRGARDGARITGIHAVSADGRVIASG